MARMQQTLRSRLIDGASDPSSARNYFPDEVEGWLKLTGYHGDAADKAYELCETAISTLLDAAEADTNETSRNILLGQVENLLHASGWEPLLVARLEEERGTHRRSARSVRTPGTAADVRRILRKQAEWEEAAALDGDNADLEWLLKVDRLAAARPAGLGARLYEQEHRRWPKRWRRCATTIRPERRLSGPAPATTRIAANRSEARRVQVGPPPAWVPTACSSG